MTKASSVEIAARFRRSVRIDKDIHDPASLETFYCPKSFADGLLAISQHLKATGQAAFTWTGPYGGGKSSLALAFAALVAGKPKVRAIAEAAVGSRVTEALREAIRLPPAQWTVLPILAERAPLPKTLASALDIPQRGNVEKAVLRELEKRSQSGGLLVIIDELGRALEGASANPSDLDFLQDLAELASRSQRQLIVVGILHQAFDEYASRASKSARDQWAKIQGRFVDLPIATAGDETLELIQRAIDAPEERRRQVRAMAKDTAKIITPPRSPGDAKRLAETLAGCAPLHPMTACLLTPMSRRRFGQNQRSVFGFLNSAEPHGFQEFLKTASSKAVFAVDRLFDYLRANLEPSILASPDGKKWSTATEALERIETNSASAIHIRVFKAIAVMDLFKDRSGLAASEEAIPLAINAEPSAVARALRDLQKWSAIVYRRHAAAYSLFAGSDFDIEAVVAETIAADPTLDLAQLRGLADLQPRLAKRHHAATGAMRWFDVSVALVSDLAQGRDVAPRPNAMGTLVLAVPGASEAFDEVKRTLQAAVDAESRFDLVVGWSDQSSRLADLTRELAALRVIERQRTELQGDAIARREVTARIAELRGIIESVIDSAFEAALWFRAGAVPRPLSRRGVQELISELADARYPDSPRTHNELLNRSEPSTNAVAARTVLMKRMALNESEPQLGISGYPAEGGMFQSLFGVTGLHRLTGQGYRFCDPTTLKRDPSNVAPLWRAADALLARQEKALVSAQDVFHVWTAKPIGLKEGLCPVYFLAYALSRRESLGLYRDRIFQARFDDLSVEFLARDARDIQIRKIDLSQSTRDLLLSLAQAIGLKDGATPFSIAKELVAQFDELPPWTKRTQRLSSSTFDLRELLKRASDPNQLVFDDLARLSSAAEGGATKVALTIRDALAELRAAYPNTLEELKALMLKELDVRVATTAGLETLRERANTIRNVGGDLRLNAFINRLAQFHGTVADMEGLASLAADKLPRDWNDSDRERAALGLAELAQQFLRMETFARVKGRQAHRSAMALVVGVENQPTPLFREFEISDADRKDIAALVTAVEATLASANQTSRNVILAALAEISTRYMQNETREKAKTTKRRRS
jgi:hypothetical protein